MKIFPRTLGLIRPRSIQTTILEIRNSLLPSGLLIVILSFSLHLQPEMLIFVQAVFLRTPCWMGPRSIALALLDLDKQWTCSDERVSIIFLECRSFQTCAFPLTFFQVVMVQLPVLRNSLFVGSHWTTYGVCHVFLIAQRVYPCLDSISATSSDSAEINRSQQGPAGISCISLFKIII